MSDTPLPAFDRGASYGKDFNHIREILDVAPKRLTALDLELAKLMTRVVEIKQEIRKWEQLERAARE